MTGKDILILNDDFFVVNGVYFEHNSTYTLHVNDKNLFVNDKQISTKCLVGNRTQHQISLEINNKIHLLEPELFYEVENGIFNLSTLHDLRQKFIQSNPKHLYQTDHLIYAHFSKIILPDIKLFPELATQHEFELNAGDALIIPPGWWHLIRNKTNTQSINFWNFTGDVICGTQIDVSNVNLYKNLITNSVLNQLLEANPPKFSYCKSDGITLDAYAKGSLNRSILNPDSCGLLDGKCNIWFAGADSSVGLHFDDKIGILIMLAGTKNVKLYPPFASKMLYGMPLSPPWSNYTTTLCPRPNETTFSKCAERKTQGQELFALLKSKATTQHIFNITDATFKIYGENAVTFGIKKTSVSNSYRVEFYVGHAKLNRLNFDIEPAKQIIEKINQTYAVLGKIYSVNLSSMVFDCISAHSYSVKLDEQPEIKPADIDIYFYDGIKNGGIVGRVGTFTVGKFKPTGEMYGSAQTLIDNTFVKTFINNDAQYNFYKDMCATYGLFRMCFIWKKNPYLMIHWLGVKTDIYLDFLRKYDFDKAIYDVVNSSTNYVDANVCHDIALTIDTDCNVVQSAIYGCL
jgi:hypothetical protein